MAENNGIAETMIAKLREKVVGEKDLISCTEDAFLIRFLRARNFDCDKAFQLLLNYYKLWVDYPELYKNFRPSAPAMKEVQSQNFRMRLPQRDDRGRCVFIARDGLWDPRRSSSNDLFIDFHIHCEVEIRKIETQMNGIIIIHDVSNIGLQHAQQCGPSNLKKMIHFVEDSFPALFLEFHFVNVNPIFKMIYKLIKPLLSKEIKEKIYIHTKLEDLHKCVNPSILPAEFGGNKNFLFDNSEGIKEVMDFEQEIIKLSKFGYKSVVKG